MNPRYGMAIDLDRCTGCGACMIACSAENNVPQFPGATDRTGLTPMLVHSVAVEGRGRVFFPVMCMHCEHETPCATVCPQQAVQLDKSSGIVVQMPQRCFGCRYCMTACPYHARYFNWWDPKWPVGMERTLNPGVAVRMRGVVEKCNLCVSRLHAAQDKAAAAKKRTIDPKDYIPACVESCPTRAITFGDLNDGKSDVAKAARSDEAFRLLSRLRTEPKVFYTSKRDWVRSLADRADQINMKERNGEGSAQERRRG